ncbi:type II asparaginase [Proteus mirabilis]|uniref:type II asparaginase n=1 Tax=Proteus mirabilis TaxID=584 RepID=UPI000F5C043C|nr:type II asparaginase [Proteus mirabilis]MBS3827251.1 type II asparaginase [Proteus mirabilis]MBS3838064.1 type II asparaginase [Proteus mirabilis]MDC9788166.1 type II asparaginase [Proteus mirabilis]RQW15923.1 type II asparaginase [Proteus mirabilis]
MKRNFLKNAIGFSLLAASTLAFGQTDIKPGVTIFATGGTIAGKASTSSDATDYKAGELSVGQLISAVPSLEDVATISGVQIANVPSGDIEHKTLLSLAKQINQVLQKAEQSGVVITHGTDTLEETAFFLTLTVKSEKPVVLVGAMRPSTAISADGPMNLLQAVTLAASKEARDRGTLVTLNDRISSGFYVSKTNANVTDTFKAFEPGYLGTFVKGQPYFYYSAAQITNKPFFDISQKSALPKVTILYAHQEQDPELLKAAVAAGAKGIIIAGAGNAAVPKTVNKVIGELMAQGIPVVLSTRTGSGFTTVRPDGSQNGIAAGIYSPQKARMLLMLALSETQDMTQIGRYFEMN